MKKILSFVLVLVMLMSFSVPFVNAEESTEYTYVPSDPHCPGVDTYRFSNPYNWEEVYVYATGGWSGEDGKMTYPGIKLEEENGCYTYTVAVGYYDTIVFNDGNRTDNEVKAKFYDYCVEKLGKPSDGADVRIEKAMKYYDGTVVFTATSWEEPQGQEVNVIIGNTCHHRSATYSPYELGVYVSTNDEIYTLEEAFGLKGFFGVSMDHGFSGYESHMVYKENMDLDLVHKCLYAFGNRYGYKPQEGEGIYSEPLGYVGENLIFYAYYAHYDYPAMNTQEQIGDYYFYAGSPCGIGKNNSVALYVLTPENKVYTLYEAYTEGVVTDLESVAKFTRSESIYKKFGKRICELLGIDTEDEDCKYLYREIRTFSECGNPYDEDTTPELVIVEAGESTTDEATSISRIGRYVVANDYTYYPYGVGYYVYSTYEDKVYTLEEAYEAYPDYADTIISLLDYPSSGHYRLVGNVDYDNRITIRDATRLQKRIAGYALDDVEYPELEYAASDFNGDGDVNIKDVTAIQKYLAGFEH